MGSPAMAICDDPDNPSDQDDCDEDGYTSADGDCDDDDADRNPGVEEVCADEVDNNCDGDVDEDCDNGLIHGELMGGSACGQSGGGLAWLAPLVLVGRRRR
jgi:hypothetical protein